MKLSFEMDNERQSKKAANAGRIFIPTVVHVEWEGWEEGAL